MAISLCGVMITNPNTSGIFETDFKKIADDVHQAGGLVYMDGANMNAIAGIINLAELGVDAVHNNLHKTWTIPHGGGGPGDAIVAVSEKLVDFLPGKQIIKMVDGTYDFEIPFIPLDHSPELGKFWSQRFVLYLSFTLRTRRNTKNVIRRRIICEISF